MKIYMSVVCFTFAFGKLGVQNIFALATLAVLNIFAFKPMSAVGGRLYDGKMAAGRKPVGRGKIWPKNKALESLEHALPKGGGFNRRRPRGESPQPFTLMQALVAGICFQANFVDFRRPQQIGAVY